MLLMLFKTAAPYLKLCIKYHKIYLKKIAAVQIMPCKIEKLRKNLDRMIRNNFKHALTIHRKRL